MVTLNLSVEEVQGILNVLGDLPTKSNAYPLLIKIKEQAETQLVPMPEAVADDEAA